MIGGDRFGGWEYHTIYEVGEGVSQHCLRDTELCSFLTNAVFCRVRPSPTVVAPPYLENPRNKLEKRE